MGGQEGVGDGVEREAEGEVHYTLEQESSRCVLTEVQKRAPCTCLAETVVGSSFTPSAALLVHPSGTVQPIANCHELIRS